MLGANAHIIFLPPFYHCCSKMAPQLPKKSKHVIGSTRGNDASSRSGKKRHTDVSFKNGRKDKNSSSQNQTHFPSSQNLLELGSESEESVEPSRLHNNANESEDNTDSEQVFSQKVDRHQYADDNEDLDERPEPNLEETHFGMIERINALERKVATLERKFSDQAVTFLMNKKSSKSKFELPNNGAMSIQIFARDHLFRTFKYFDQNCIEQEGETIYRRCLARAKMNGSEADQETLYAAVKRVIVSSLTGKRGHVKDKIRDEAKGMFLLLILFLMSSLILKQPQSFQDIATREESAILLKKWYNHVKDFRVGHFENATDEVKTAWITFVDNIIVKINGIWKNEVKLNKLLSKEVDATDEAYALHVSANNMEFWVNEAKAGKKGQKRKPVATSTTKQDNNEEEDEGNSALNPEYQQDIENYYDWLEKIQEKRELEDEGASWDIGYRNAVTLSFKNLPSSVSIGTAVSSLDSGAVSGQDGYHGGKKRKISFGNSWKDFE